MNTRMEMNNKPDEIESLYSNESGSQRSILPADKQETQPISLFSDSNAQPVTAAAPVRSIAPEVLIRKYNGYFPLEELMPTGIIDPIPGGSRLVVSEQPIEPSKGVMQMRSAYSEWYRNTSSKNNFDWKEMTDEELRKMVEMTVHNPSSQSPWKEIAPALCASGYRVQNSDHAMAAAFFDQKSYWNAINNHLTAYRDTPFPVAPLNESVVIESIQTPTGEILPLLVEHNGRVKPSRTNRFGDMDFRNALQHKSMRIGSIEVPVTEVVSPTTIDQVVQAGNAVYANQRAMDSQSVLHHLPNVPVHQEILQKIIAEGRPISDKDLYKYILRAMPNTDAADEVSDALAEVVIQNTYQRYAEQANQGSNTILDYTNALQQACEEADSACAKKIT